MSSKAKRVRAKFRAYTEWRWMCPSSGMVTAHSSPGISKRDLLMRDGASNLISAGYRIVPGHFVPAKPRPRAAKARGGRGK